ncbi:GNAT family N-acetyltransferase [Microbacterium sp. NPDC076911]|uniref:GNAT family N-acetyltransferase n=1 Tax=Microbacterium sp. NPDC076911 TaxID=3154958 RepID=UPI0034302B74
MTTSADETTVARNEKAGRYEIHVGDVLAGFADYKIDSHERVSFPHTEIDPAFAGRGLAKLLVRDAMADSAARNDTVVPHCPFVEKYLKRNPVEGLEVVWPDEPHPE